jgi:hypothetical protein
MLPRVSVGHECCRYAMTILTSIPSGQIHLKRLLDLGRMWAYDWSSWRHPRFDRTVVLCRWEEDVYSNYDIVLQHNVKHQQRVVLLHRPIYKETSRLVNNRPKPSPSW